MNQPVIVTTLVALLAGLTTAMAQSPTQSDGSAGSPTAASQSATKGSIRSARESATDADARLCLELPTNAQVIACAEKYRPDRRRS